MPGLPALGRQTRAGRRAAAIGRVGPVVDASAASRSRRSPAQAIAAAGLCQVKPVRRRGRRLQLCVGVHVRGTAGHEQVGRLHVQVHGVYGWPRERRRVASPEAGRLPAEVARSASPCPAPSRPWTCSGRTPRPTSSTGSRPPQRGSARCCWTPASRATARSPGTGRRVSHGRSVPPNTRRTSSRISPLAVPFTGL